MMAATCHVAAVAADRLSISSLAARQAVEDAPLQVPTLSSLACHCVAAAGADLQCVVLLWAGVLYTSFVRVYCAVSCAIHSNASVWPKDVLSVSSLLPSN